jgi:hypothetical protein
MFSWFDSTEAKQIGQSIALQFIAGIPVETLKNLYKISPKQKKVVENIHSQLLKINAEKKFNPYKKAKLADAFQKELLKANYEPDFVRRMTKEVVLHLGSK